MSYTLAPATALLATDCLCCGRELLDAASVTAGIGPVCRKKYGYTEEITEESRVAANALIHEAAIATCSNERRAAIADELEALGLVKLATKVRDRFMKPDVKIARETVVFGKGKWERSIDGTLVVSTSYSPAFNASLKSTIDWRDRKPVFEAVVGKKDRFVGWAIKPGAKKALWSVLREHFAGKALLNPEGAVSYIPAAS